MGSVITVNAAGTIKIERANNYKKLKLKDLYLLLTSIYVSAT
jgi:hypothetical protein